MQQDLFEGNHKILRGSGYLTWLNADMRQATHRLTSESSFSLFISFSRFPSLTISVSLCGKKKCHGVSSYTDFKRSCRLFSGLPQAGVRQHWFFLHLFCLHFHHRYPVICFAYARYVISKNWIRRKNIVLIRSH